MIYIICGKPREGKTQYAVSLIFDLVKKNRIYEDKLKKGIALKPEKKEEVRPIYADIDGLNIDGVLESPLDWRDTPDGSVIFYDEVHFRKEYEDLNGKYSQNPMIKELTTHGHRNIDIYLITQDAKRLERSVRGLVDAMYYVKRPQNKPPFATVYTFDKFYNEPSSAAAADKAHDDRKFIFKKEYQDAYKSASAHTSMSFKIQRKFIYAAIAIAVMMYLSYTLLMSSPFIGMVKKADMHGLDNIGKPVKSTSVQKTTTDNPVINSAPMTPEPRYSESKRIAFVVSTGSFCMAKNSWGEILDIPLSHCLLVASSPIYLSNSREASKGENTRSSSPSEPLEPPKEI